MLMWCVSPAGWKHTIHIYFVPGKKFSIAFFSGYMNYMYYKVVILFGAFQPFLSLREWVWVPGVQA